MSSFKDLQYQRQEKLIETSDIFNNDPAHGMYRGKERPFVLMDGMNNLYAPIRNEVVKYFRDNKISWWGGYRPTGHMLSSQVACLNHLFAIRNDKDAVLALLNGVMDEFEDVLPILCDNNPTYIAFEVCKQ